MPFLVNHRPAEYGPIIDTWHAGGAALLEAERERFDWDHAEVATWIAQEWDLPPGMASAIGGHHTPGDPLYDCPPPVALVANLSDAEESLEQFCRSLDTHFSADAIDSLIQNARVAVDDFSRFLV